MFSYQDVNQKLNSANILLLALINIKQILHKEDYNRDYITFGRDYITFEILVIDITHVKLKKILY